MARSTEVPVRIEYDGKQYSGFYTHKNKVLTVHGHGVDATMPSRTTMQDGPAELMAKTLLREMINAGELEPDRDIENGKR